LQPLVASSNSTSSISITHTPSLASSTKTTIVTVSSSIKSMPSSHGTSNGAGSESIYRTIMNRLTVLETNSSLGIRYIEEQTRSVREALKRLEQDVGRLENMVRVEISGTHKWCKSRGVEGNVF
jgi:hypothetical protein